MVYVFYNVCAPSDRQITLRAPQHLEKLGPKDPKDLINEDRKQCFEFSIIRSVLKQNMTYVCFENRDTFATTEQNESQKI